MRKYTRKQLNELAPRSLIDADLLMRWAVENLVALGMELDNALLVSQAVVRKVLSSGSDGDLGVLLDDMDQMALKQMPIDPVYSSTRLSDWAIEIHQVQSRGEFAIAAAIDFATHAAIIFDQGAAIVSAPLAFDDISAVFQRLAQDGLASIAIESRAMAVTSKIFCFIPCSSSASGFSSVVSGSPPKQVGQAVFTLADVCRLVGVKATVPDALSIPCADGLQILIVHNDRLQEGVRILCEKLNFSSLRQAGAVPATTQVSICPLVESRMCRLSAKLKTFNPFG